MLKKLLFVPILTVLALVSVSLAADFSVDQIISGKGMPNISSKIFISGDKIRVESSSGRISSIVITRPDKKVSWTLIPNQRMYMEAKIDPRHAVTTGYKMPGEKREKIGKETVNGINCDKFRVTYKNKAVSPSVFLWLSPDGIPVKVQAADKSWTSEMKNIKKGAQSPYLFEIPLGYSKMPTAGMPSMNQMMKIKGY